MVAERKKQITSDERLLCTNVTSWSPSDLLYYDRLVVPGAKSGVFGAGMVLLKSPLDLIRDKFYDRLLLLRPESFLPEQYIKALAEDLARGRHAAEKSQAKLKRRLVTKGLAEGRHRFSRDDKDQLVESSYAFADVEVRSVADACRRLNLRASARLRAPRLEDAYENGAGYVLEILHGRLKTIEITEANCDDMMDFLTDPETEAARGRMFVWQNEMVNRIRSGDLHPRDIPDLVHSSIMEYQAHLTLARQETSLFWASWLLKVPERVALALSGVGLPKALQGVIDIRKHQLKLKKEESKAEGRELAYLVNAAEGLSKKQGLWQRIKRML